MEGNIQHASNCNHSSTIENNYEETCTSCGLVLGTIYDQKNSNTFYINSEKIVNKKKYEQLFEIESRGFISIELAYKSISLAEKWMDENKPLKKYHLCFALYVCCKNDNHPMTLLEICNFFNTNTKIISKMEKLFEISLDNTPSYYYVHKLCKKLNLNFSYEKKITAKCKEFEKFFNIQGIIFASVIISLQCPFISLKEISENGYVSMQTIKKWQKKILTFFPNIV